METGNLECEETIARVVELSCCELGMNDEAVKVLQWFLHTKDIVALKRLR